MTMEYRCADGHVTERFFTSISAAAAVPVVQCVQCQQPASKIFSAPLGFGLYGNPVGYDKPSATKRHSTKLVTATGNKNAVG